MNANPVIVLGKDTSVGHYLTQLTDKKITDPNLAPLVCIIPPHDDTTWSAAEVEQRLVQLSPVAVVLVSSWEVYPFGVEDVIYENSRLSPDTSFGRRCLDAEQMCDRVASRLGVPLTLLRPAMIFGNGVKGEAAAMFASVIAGRYFAIHGVETPRSCVLAYDVAHAALHLAGIAGVFNITDGHPHSLRQIADAMSSNTGLCKRTLSLPVKAARILAKMADFIGGKRGPLGTAALAEKLTPRTLDTEVLRQTWPEFDPYDTLSVLSRQDKNYPYEQP